jgi:CheY-like chemotaxis protein
LNVDLFVATNVGLVTLIVEDNAAMRATIRSMLYGVESDFCECSDGKDALEMYRSCLPRIVLMDVRMKHLDGITATRQILASFPDARVIIVTEYDDPALRKEAQEAGAVAFVRKDDLSNLHAHFA